MSCNCKSGRNRDSKVGEDRFPAKNEVMVERRRIIKPKRKSPCELCEDELGKEGSFYNRETKKCDCKREEGYLLGKYLVFIIIFFFKSKALFQNKRQIF